MSPELPNIFVLFVNERGLSESHNLCLTLLRSVLFKSTSKCLRHLSMPILQLNKTTRSWRTIVFLVYCKRCLSRETPLFFLPHDLHITGMILKPLKSFHKTFSQYRQSVRLKNNLEETSVSSQYLSDILRFSTSPQKINSLVWTVKFAWGYQRSEWMCRFGKIFFYSLTVP